jgi:hypothetical protein
LTWTSSTTRWKAQQHNYIGQMQTKDTLLDQCINLRRVYEERIAEYATKFPDSTPTAAYDAVSGVKTRPGGITPAEELLRAANFTYMKKPNKTEYMGSFYPHLRAFCLKDKDVWKQFKRIMTDFQEARIPHPNMSKAIDLVNRCFKENEKKPGKFMKKLPKILSENK